MFISPNLEVNTDKDSNIISPEMNRDGKVDSYMFVEKLGAGKVPIILSEKIDRKRILLGKVNETESMYLYPNGKIKIEV